MIKLFRNIRYDLMEKNKIGKYLKYAIGEIVLVVIGILIALSINNWNQQRLEKIEEVSTLQSMKKDFIDSKENIESTIELQKRAMRNTKGLIGVMYAKAIETPFDSIGNYIILGALSYYKVEPLTGTYDALIGSGKISIIKNEELNRKLAEYSAKLKFGFEDEDYCIQLTTLLTEKCSAFLPFLMPDRLKESVGIDINYYDKGMKEAFAEHLENTSFIGILLQKYFMERNRLSYQIDLLEDVDMIINQINSELERKAK